MITIIDYGMGNLGSVVNMLHHVEVECEVAGDPARIAGASRILLPGVGAFDAAMERIDATGIRPILDEKALRERVPCSAFVSECSYSRAEAKRAHGGASAGSKRTRTGCQATLA